MSNHADATPVASEPEPVVVTPSVLRDWPLPKDAASKHGRGRVVVVGGAAQTPGAVMLAGIAALRVGAGHLTMVVAESVAAAVAAAVPEAGVIGAAQTATGSVRGDAVDTARDAVGQAHTVLIGPGLDDPDQTRELLRNIVGAVDDDARVVLDAYALGVLDDVMEAVRPFTGRWVLTPNSEEAARLLHDPADPAAEAAAPMIARQRDAVVTLGGVVAHPDGRRWHSGLGHPGLATSGSGDVLAGAIAGLLGRGAEPAQAAVWGTYAHAAAGERLAAQIAPVGFLARELLPLLPAVLAELDA